MAILFLTADREVLHWVIHRHESQPSSLKLYWKANVSKESKKVFLEGDLVPSIKGPFSYFQELVVGKQNFSYKNMHYNLALNFIHSINIYHVYYVPGNI